MSVRVPLSESARAARRLGVLGGSFDPPHLGHLHAARAARAAFELEHVLFVPASHPPHKPGRTLAAAGERLAMLELLLEGEPWTSVWDAELVRPGPSYTIDTLCELRTKIAPEARLFLVLGHDNLSGFVRWRDVERIVLLAQPIVVQRRGEELPGAALARLSRGARTRIEIGTLAVQAFDASSSELRQRLARGEAPDASLPPRLRDHLVARTLYRSR